MSGTGKSTPIQRRVYLFERLYAEMKANEPYARGGELSITFSLGADPFDDKVETNKPDRHQFRSYLVAFRQFISPGDAVFLGALLGDLTPHVHDTGLRKRLRRATGAWNTVQEAASIPGQLTLGQFAPGRKLARLYLYGGIFHSDPTLVAIWDSLAPNDREFEEWAFRQYDGEVREVIVELKRVVEEARAGGYLRDDQVDATTLADEATVHRGITSLTFNGHELALVSGDLERDDDRWSIVAALSAAVPGGTTQAGWAEAMLDDGSSFRGYGATESIVTTQLSGSAPSVQLILVPRPEPRT